MNFKFAKEFTEIKKILEGSKKVLLVAHSRPDGDTVGSVFALKEYMKKDLAREAVAVCPDEMPLYLKNFLEEDFSDFRELKMENFNLLVGCDAVGKGFERIVTEKKKNQKVIFLDHHATLEVKNIAADLVINEEKYSSVCELLYDFFYFHRVEISKKMATCLLTGILGDTGLFQHANTSARVMEIAADLMRKGAPMDKIVQVTFKNKKLETLKLWGKALDRAQINKKTGAILSYITSEDLKELKIGQEDVGKIAELLNTVAGTKFSLVLLEKGGNWIKGSLRSDEHKNVDVSEIAQKLRGGGHRLASGFEIKGKLVKNEDGWMVG